MPKTLNIQGKRTNATRGLVNETANFSFRIYDAFTSGNELWEENQTLTVNEGIYDTILGNDVLLDLDFNQSYYLSIEVNEDGEMPMSLESESGHDYHPSAKDFTTT